MSGVTETSTEITITAVCRVPFRSLGSTAALQRNEDEVELREPLGSRTVIDVSGAVAERCETPDCV